MRNILAMTLLTILVAKTSVTHAIVPVDKFTLAPDGISGNFGIAIEGEQGTRKEQEYNVNGIVRYGWTGNQSLVWISDFNYTKTDGQRKENDFFTHLRFIENDYFSQNVDAEVFIQYEYDDFADLSSRELIGGGIRWRFETIEGETKYRSQFGAGAFYEAEESESTSASENTVRTNFYAKFRYISKDQRPFELYATAYLQPSVENVDDIRVLIITGVEFPITGALSLSIEAQLDHDSEPFEGIKKTNVEYGIKLSYAF